MKGNKMCRLHLILLYVCLILCTGCISGERKDAHVVTDEWKIKQMELLLENDPGTAMDKMDSLLPYLKDSMSYYRGIVFKSKAYMLMSRIGDASRMLRQAGSFCTSPSEEDKSDLYASVCNMEGNILARQAKFDSARVKFLQAYELYMHTGNKLKRFNVMLNLVDAFLREGACDKGALWYHRSLRLADSLGLPKSQCFPVYYGLGQVYMQLHDFERCDFYFDRAGEYYDEMKPYEKGIYLNNRGNSYYYRQDYKTALKYFRRSLAHALAHPEMEYERNLTMINLGEVFLLMNQTDSASYYLSRCRDFFQKEDNNSALYYIDTQLIELALKEGNLSLAKKRLDEAVVPDFVEPNMVHIRNRYLQHYFEESKDYRRAYYYLVENSRIDDSIRSERIKMRTQEIAMKYRRDSILMKKEMLIQQAENKVLHLNQWLYGGEIVLLVFMLIAGAWIAYRSRKRDKEEWMMRNAMTSLRLKNIRNRISPHFIFNVLNREISSLKDRESNHRLYELVKLIRYNLELTESLAVTLAEELDFVKTYIGLEEQVLQPGFEFHIDIDPALDIHRVKIPVMLLQIPVENAVKHALSCKDGIRMLWIEVKKDKDCIKALVRDNGGGFKVKSNSYGTGTGMKVLSQTIQLLNSYNRYPLIMQINNVEIKERGELGCEVKFTIPLDYSYLLGRAKDTNLWKRCIEQLSLMMKRVQ